MLLCIAIFKKILFFESNIKSGRIRALLMDSQICLRVDLPKILIADERVY